VSRPGRPRRRGDHGVGFTAAIRSERAGGIPTEDLGIGGTPGTPGEFVRFAESQGEQCAWMQL
jgi:hypothetical protein